MIARRSWIAADPAEAAERLAIVETSAVDFQAGLHRTRQTEPGPSMAELLRAGYRAAKAADPEWTPDWPAWQRIMGATDGPVSDRRISENRKQCNPPRKSFGFSWELRKVWDPKTGDKVEAYRPRGRSPGGKFIGAGRGGKWWAGARAPLTWWDTKGEALAEVDRQAERGRRVAALAARGLLEGAGSSRGRAPRGIGRGRAPRGGGCRRR